MLREDKMSCIYWYNLLNWSMILTYIDFAAAKHLPSFQLCDGYSDKLQDFHKRLGIGTSSINSLLMDLYHEHSFILLLT